jgi:hypothetical protein
VNSRAAGVLQFQGAALRRQGLDALRSLGAHRIQGVRRSRDVLPEPPLHQAPQIRPRLRAWDAWGVALLRIDLVLLFPGIVGPDLPVRLPACDRKSVFRAAARFQWLREGLKRWTLCRPAAARFAASPCGAARGQ